MGLISKNKIEKLMVRPNSSDELPVILNGSYTAAKLAKYSRKRLESVVTRLMKITSKEGTRKENCKRPKWWPKELVFVYPLENLKKCTPDAIWNQVLRKLVLLCRNFYVDNCSIKDVQLDENRGRQTKKSKQAVLKEVHQNSSLVVCLHDILKTKHKGVSKSEFIERLNLIPVASRYQAVNHVNNATVLKSVKLASIPSVPFSSDYAQVLLKREKQGFPQEVHLKRLERIERYLKNDTTVLTTTLPEYSVTYDKKQELCCRIYRFPVRQSYQVKDKIEFLKNLCTPVSVMLVRYDELSKNEKQRKSLKVVLSRLKIQPTRLRDRNRKNVCAK